MLDPVPMTKLSSRIRGGDAELAVSRAAGGPETAWDAEESMHVWVTATSGAQVPTGRACRRWGACFKRTALTASTQLVHQSTTQSQAVSTRGNTGSPPRLLPKIASLPIPETTQRPGRDGPSSPQWQRTDVSKWKGVAPWVSFGKEVFIRLAETEGRCLIPDGNAGTPSLA